jgi:outer membrane receptor protein involved in Fe transport
LRFKFGIKNIFNYKDPSRFNTEILNTYDPGRRYFIEFSFDFRKDNNVW